MSCTPCGRSIPDIIRLARLHPKLHFCQECMSVWTPAELAEELCPECGEDEEDPDAGLEEV